MAHPYFEPIRQQEQQQQQHASTSQAQQHVASSSHQQPQQMAQDENEEQEEDDVLPDACDARATVSVAAPVASISKGAARGGRPRSARAGGSNGAGVL